MELERFHSDLMAALETRVPLEIGESSIVRLTKSKLNRFRESVVASLGETPEPESLDQLNDLSSNLPKRYLAALRTFAQTESMAPVLDGLTIRVTSMRKIKRLLRRVLLYLSFVLAAALLGLLIFSSNVSPVIEAVRTDTFLQQEELANRFDFIQWLPTFTVALAVMLILLVIWMLLGGATRTAMWLGGRKYVRCWTSATALRIMQLLSDKGMDVKDALQVSCDLAGVDGVGRRELQSVVLHDQAEGSTNLAQSDLQSFGNYLLVLSEHRLERMRLSVPIVLIALLGGLSRLFTAPRFFRRLSICFGT